LVHVITVEARWRRNFGRPHKIARLHQGGKNLVPRVRSLHFCRVAQDRPSACLGIEQDGVFLFLHVTATQIERGALLIAAQDRGGIGTAGEPKEPEMVSIGSSASILRVCVRTRTAMPVSLDQA
jgi:hypothetical protein